MKVIIVFAFILGLMTLTVPGLSQNSPTGAPERLAKRGQGAPVVVTYSQAMKTWKSIATINQWIGECFRYDMERALSLSEVRLISDSAPPVMTPEEFFNNPKGVCVDLTRFAVESARQVAPASRPSYLMIKFEPLVIKGQVLRRHWLAVYKGNGGYYSFADSNRPGHIAGPYASLNELVNDYEGFRQRRVVSYKLLNGFGKIKRERAQNRLPKSPMLPRDLPG